MIHPKVVIFSQASFSEFLHDLGVTQGLVEGGAPSSHEMHCAWK